MSIKIHHGPGGTYKTSGAINDDILGVIKSGRCLVTNVRGFSRAQALKVLGEDKVHPDWEVIFLDTDLAENRHKMARFFHWAPKGAYICIDEVQRIWNPKLTSKELKALDYVGGEIKAQEDDRPEDIYAAFDMHRHHNWDFSLTTTHIKKVHTLIRENTEMAYRHVNMAVIGIKGRYKEITHDKENGGTSASHQISVKNKKIPKFIFELYQSTKTGDVSDSMAGSPLWKDPKIGGMLFAVVCLWVYLLGFASTPRVLTDVKAEIVATDKEGAQVSVENSSETGSTVDSNQIVGASGASGNSSDGLRLNVSQMPYINRFDDIWLTGALLTSGRGGNVYTFGALINDTEYHFNSVDLLEMGYVIVRKTTCLVDLIYGDKTQVIYCGLAKTESKVFEAPTVENSSII